MSDPPGILKLFSTHLSPEFFLECNTALFSFNSHVPHGEIIINRCWVESLVRMNAQHLNARWGHQLPVLCKNPTSFAVVICTRSWTIVMSTVIVHRIAPLLFLKKTSRFSIMNLSFSSCTSQSASSIPSSAHQNVSGQFCRITGLAEELQGPDGAAVSEKGIFPRILYNFKILPEHAASALASLEA